MYVLDEEKKEKGGSILVYDGDTYNDLAFLERFC